ncbi:MAG TPA: S8 family serine peptidase, partial [Blastocatellia bacterium]|nr:S8 family serine peptidase [Blastocatellia bacterium]
MPNKTKLSPTKMLGGLSLKARLILAVFCLAGLGAGFMFHASLFPAANASGKESSASKRNSAKLPKAAAQDQTVIRSADTERAFAELAEKARGGKPVKVIIGVNLPVAFRSEGLLRRQEDKDAQHLLIARAQESLLNRLQANSRESVKRFKYIPYLAMEVSAEELELLKASPEVFQIQEDALSKPTLNESTRVIGADAAWASGFTGAGQTVAILDTGVDGTHPALSGKVVSEACFSTDNGSDRRSLCPGGVTSSTAAGSGVNCTGVGGCDHGTHVAGIAAGRPGTNASGDTLTGVARDANVIAIQVFTRFTNNSDCDGSAPCVKSFASDQISGMERVRDLANMVDGGGNPIFRIASVNMSLGDDSNNSSSCNGDSRKAAIDNLRSLGIATVISAGNEGHRAGVGVPACISTAISVGSTDKDDTVSSFSNNAGIVSILAPGGSIESTLSGGGYGFKSGTSMAAPHVTGAWAVFKSAPGHGSDSVATVLTQFQNTGVPVTDTRMPSPTNLVRP